MVNLCPDNLWFFASVEVVGPGGSVCSCLGTPVVRCCFLLSLKVVVRFFLLVTIIVDLDLLLALLWGCFLLLVLL